MVDQEQDLTIEILKTLYSDKNCAFPAGLAQNRIGGQVKPQE